MRLYGEFVSGVSAVAFLNDIVMYFVFTVKLLVIAIYSVYVCKEFFLPMMHFL